MNDTLSLLVVTLWLASESASINSPVSQTGTVCFVPGIGTKSHHIDDHTHNAVEKPIIHAKYPIFKSRKDNESLQEGIKVFEC